MRRPVAIGKRRRVADAQQVENRRGQVLRLDPAVARIAAVLVARSIDLRPADAGAGQHEAEDMPPVVAAAVRS